MGYNIQNARADVITIRESKSRATQQQKNQVIDYFKLTGYHVDPESKYKHVEMVINYPKQVMVLVKMGIKDFSYNEVSYASELTFDKIWIRPKDTCEKFEKSFTNRI
jgi:hypothetical protein